LDRVAILTRVKSDSNLNLNDCLRNLQVRLQNTSPHLIWGKLKQLLEDNIPPSLMSIHSVQSGGWGYKRLNLVMDGTLFIKPTHLQWIEKEEMGERPLRLNDILARMGEAATSPEVAHFMLSPTTMAACLEGKAVNISNHFMDRDYVISNMQCTPQSLELLACLPVVEHTRFPGHIIAWRLDLPPRVILYHGVDGEVDILKTPPYLLKKTSMPDKLLNRTLSGISILNGPAPNALKACISQEIVHPYPDFADHPLHKVNIKVQGRSEVHHTTTLAEAVHIFTGQSPFRTSEVALHASEPWNEAHIDDRYAERQTAANGTRYRDWVTVYHAEHETQRCRIASHSINCQDVYETYFPLSTPKGNVWVSVASSIPAETRMLRHMGGSSSVDVYNYRNVL
jgi:hypothetical protein